MYSKEDKEKIKNKVLELLEKSFEVDDITEKKHNPAWAIVTYILNKYNQRLKADVVIPMRPGRCLGPYYSWKPEDLSNMMEDD